jgi:sugar phosphate isomerase/epimerase
MRRRDFLAQAVGGLAVAGLLRTGERLGAAPRAGSAGTRDKRRRIGVSTWSFHQYFPATRGRAAVSPEKVLELLDFPEMIADQYKIHHLEFVAPHFGSVEPSYLQDLKARLTNAHSHLVNIPVDIRELHRGGGLSDPDEAVRGAALQGAKKWIDIGAQLGTRAVRCDPGRMNPENLTPTIDSYKQLAAYGKSKGVDVVIENHGGVGSEHPEELVKLFQGVGKTFKGALPDFGNFPDEPTRERGLRLLFPYARVLCHAKGLEFDAQGNETNFNFARCMEIAKQAGFKGIYSIEFEGSGDPYVGVQKTLDELLRFL